MKDNFLDVLWNIGMSSDTHFHIFSDVYNISTKLFEKVRIESSIENNGAYTPNILIDVWNNLSSKKENKQQLLSILKSVVNSEVFTAIENLIYSSEKEVSLWINKRSEGKYDYNIWFIGEAVSMKEVQIISKHFQIDIEPSTAEKYFLSLNFSKDTINCLKVYEIFPIQEYSRYKEDYPMLWKFVAYGQEFFHLKRYDFSWGITQKWYISIYDKELSFSKKHITSLCNIWFSSEYMSLFFEKKLVWAASNSHENLELYFDLFRTW